MKPKLEVDPQGLAKLLEKKGKAWVLFELLQNGIDEPGVTRVSLTLEPVAGRPVAKLIVEDDSPEGFRDLAHAYTLFAESYKKGNPNQRGLWNLGEKLVLVLCNHAEIASTKGTIIFEGNSRRESRAKRDRGTVFSGEIRMTRSEVADVSRAVQRVIPPAGIKISFNGAPLECREPAHAFEAILPTRTTDAEGNLVRTSRKTTVELFEEHEPWIYEMGIPICALEGGERWSVNVGQKVPLNMQRDNVTAAYLKTLRVLVLNEMHESLRKEDVTQPWAAEATDDSRCNDAATTAALDLRYGEKRVIYDPSDPEGTKIAMSQGYSIIYGAAHSKQTWENIKRAGAALPAGQVTPSPEAYGDGPLAEQIPESEWTDDQRRVVAYVQDLAIILLVVPIKVRLVRVPITQFSAAWCYNGPELHLNVNALGPKWFAEILEGFSVEAHRLLIHEFAHHEEGDHLSEEFHRECCRLGAELVKIALETPEVLKGMFA